MRDFIGILSEARGSAKMLTATKARNAFVKAAKANGFDAAPYRGFGSNPYSSTQVLSMSLGKRAKGGAAGAKKLVKALKGAGLVAAKSQKSKQIRRRYDDKADEWVEGPADYWSIEAESPDNPRVRVSIFAFSREVWNVQIFGPKKAKASTRPYYD